MNQRYKMKGSFDDGATWYQLEWFNIEFKDFETISNKCNSIEELVEEIKKAYPESKLQYEYLGERNKSSKNTRKRK